MAQIGEYKLYRFYVFVQLRFLGLMRVALPIFLYLTQANNSLSR